jgi:hypothetical protein
MYTLEQLQQKNIKELKEIGLQLNVLPEGDKRCRQNWIDALVGVNLPLLQLLELSPAASVVEQVQPIIETVETPSAVEVEPVQTLPIESKFGRIVYPWPAQKSIAQAAQNSPGVEVDRVQTPDSVICWECEGSGQLSDAGVFWDCCQCENGLISLSSLETKDPDVLLFHYGTTCAAEAFKHLQKKQKLIVLAAQNSPGVDPGVDVDRAQEPIAQAAQNSPGVEVDSVQEPIAPVAENSPGVKTEATVSESAIAPAAKNPILTGLTFSDKFLARYAPPQAQIIHFQSDADGQLSLLNFEVEFVDESPDPDDFEFLDAFCEALARWDWEHNEVSPEHNELLQVSLDSFCLWVPCPPDWYEPTALLEPSSMLELSQTCKSSITSDFFIPTFDCLSDRQQKRRTAQHSDFCLFAQTKAVQLSPDRRQPNRIPNSTQTQPKLNSIAYQIQLKLNPNSTQSHTKLNSNSTQTQLNRIAAGSSTQPARSPPGGDARLV